MGPLPYALGARAQHFPSNLYPYPDHNHQHRPMPTHSMTRVHPCPPMLFKLRPCIQKLCNVYYYPPTPSLGWIRQIKGRSMSLASAWSESWLAYSLHPRSLTPIWSWMQGCTKLMPTHEQYYRTHAHPKPMGMGMGMGTQCRALIGAHNP
jgi:hypothetical protein